MVSERPLLISRHAVCTVSEVQKGEDRRMMARSLWFRRV